MAVPAMVSQMASATDPNLREARNILDTIKSRVPGLSDELPERLNLWGQPLARGKSFGPDLVSPVWVSTERNDPLMSEVARLRLGLSKPQRSEEHTSELQSLMRIPYAVFFFTQQKTQHSRCSHQPPHYYHYYPCFLTY